MNFSTQYNDVDIGLVRGIQPIQFTLFFFLLINSIQSTFCMDFRKNKFNAIHNIAINGSNPICTFADWIGYFDKILGLYN